MEEWEKCEEWSRIDNGEGIQLKSYTLILPLHCNSNTKQILNTSVEQLAHMKEPDRL